jgi:short-subunit dehydrogenase
MKSMVYVSGATGGLGRSMAVECASRGWDLFLTDMDSTKLANLAESLSAAWNVRVSHHPCDMANEASRTELLEAMQNKGIGLHMAINVAGLDYEGLFLEKSRAQIINLLNVNVMSTVDMMHSLPAFRDKTRPFRMINVCSMAGMFPMPVKATYAASKRMFCRYAPGLGWNIWSVISPHRHKSGNWQRILITGLNGWISCSITPGQFPAVI